MTDLHTIWSHVTWKDVGVFASILFATIIYAYKFGKNSKAIQGLELAIAEIHETIEDFHGKCELVNGKLIRTVTEDMLEKYCEKNQSKCSVSICRKIESVHLRLNEQAKTTKSIEDKVDHNQELITNQLGQILQSIGRLEGKMEKS